MKHFFMEYGKIIVVGALTVTGLMFTTPFAEAVTGSVANFTTGMNDKVIPKNPYAEKVNSVQKLYDVGEQNLTEEDIVQFNGIDCYVLKVESNKAKLITKNIYDVRFDEGGHNENNADGYIGCDASWHFQFTYNYKYSTLKTWMTKFYYNELNEDPLIIPTTVSYYTTSSYEHDAELENFDNYLLEHLENQYVFSLDAKEAQTYRNKFNWHITENYTKGFWITAGHRHPRFGFADGSFISNTGAVRTGGIKYTDYGARPAFWISLENNL